MKKFQTIYSVLVDAGDGSHYIEWRKKFSKEILEELEKDDSYQSGEGVQYCEYKFPADFDIDEWARINYIYWAEEDF